MKRFYFLVLLPLLLSCSRSPVEKEFKSIPVVNIDLKRGSVPWKLSVEKERELLDVAGKLQPGTSLKEAVNALGPPNLKMRLPPTNVFKIGKASGFLLSYYRSRKDLLPNVADREVVLLFSSEGKLVRINNN